MLGAMHGRPNYAECGANVQSYCWFANARGSGDPKQIKFQYQM